MAGGHVMAVGPIRHYEGRTTVYVALACILAASGGLIFGYDIGISGTQQNIIKSILLRHRPVHEEDLGKQNFPCCR
jgi:hypothetical protein